jgi:thymidylate synthase
MNNTDKVYTNLLKDIVENGVQKGDRTGTGTKSVFGRMVKFDMREGFPLLTTKKIHTKSVIHELLWFLKGDTNIKYLNDNGVTIWDEWADENGDLGPVYGKQWVNWGGELSNWEKYEGIIEDGYEHQSFPHTGLMRRKYIKGINQIQYVIDRLTKYPDCRRIMVNAWNVGELNDMKLMPCHYGFQFWTRELTIEERMEIWNKRVAGLYFGLSWGFGKTQEDALDEQHVPTRGISLAWNQRSCDVGLGIPFNIASYALLLHMVAQQVNMVPLELTGMLGDCHIYSNHMEQVKEQLTRDPYKYPSPKIWLNPEVKSIFDYKYDDIKILDYQSYPTIKMPIAV